MKTDLTVTDTKDLNELSERAEEVREEIIYAQLQIEKGYADLAKLLHEAWNKHYHILWGYSNFKDYCEEELAIKYRRAMYYVAIAETVKKLGIEWEDIEGIGWTKMRTLIPILEKEGVGDWLDIAKQYSVKALEEMVGERKLGSDIGNTGDPEIATLTFRLTQDQFDIINEALSKAKKEIDSDSNSLALEQLCYDYFMSGDDAPDKMDLSNVLDWIERSYGVTAEITGPASMEEILDEAEKEDQKERILAKQ